MPDQIPQDARDDFDAMLQLLIPFAEQMLRKHGEFYPFGAMITSTGELVPCETQTEDEMPEPSQVIAVLVTNFQNESRDGKIRAAATCHNATITQDGKKQDALILTMEHLTGGACKGYVPYTKGFLGKYRMGQLTVGRSPSQIFAPPAGQ